MEIRVKCKKCESLVDPNELVLDPIYTMMICKECVKERIMDEKVAGELIARKEASKDEKAMNPNNNCDDSPERSRDNELLGTVSADRIDEEKVKYKCPHCSYELVYNTVKNTPARCPYCAYNISKLKIV
jgi:DNA-directed RNA polymerase subunit RPC12/RpoP